MDENRKDRDLEPDRADAGERLTTNQGVPISDNQNSLRGGVRGPTLMEDFIFREKMTHFDHERIPERVVHARGSGAHGFFQVYEPLTDLTRARVFADPAIQTPVFVRFSTVVGFRGSADTVRDVRGFATKFYTEEGNWDLVGNNMPVFFIQDAIKFPDLVHAIKPEPHHEMPQASAAHDNFWDFISLMPESMHMIMWVLSDRAIPLSYRTMEGFGVHTFRLVNAEGKSRFVKFHWKPLLGVASLVWDEAQKIAGMDPDFNRRDLWEAIEAGNYPEYELGLQIVEEGDEGRFDFDLLDPTKIIPEELVPVRRVGKMTLNRNPDNFFAETEQVAFHPGHVVPGIDFSEDPLLQGRLFSYLDTQLIRLGGPNFAELPINRPIAEVHNNQRDGFMRRRVDKGPVNYEPNSRGGGMPRETAPEAGGFRSHPVKIEGEKVRVRSESFSDHFSQATLFWNSLTDVEKEHLVEATHFEFGKVEIMDVRRRMVDLLNHVDHDLARRSARAIGVALPDRPVAENHGRSSPALSIDQNKIRSTRGRRIAILAADGVDAASVAEMRQAVEAAGATAMVVSPYGGPLGATGGDQVKVDKTFLTSASVLFDAVYIPGGAEGVRALASQGKAVLWVREAFLHGKAIGATGDGVDLLAAAALPGVALAGEAEAGEVIASMGVVSLRHAGDAPGGALGPAVAAFLEAVAEHRHWGRGVEEVPA